MADTEQLLRIIQSIPSPKAEPFKMWLAQVGRERIEETIDPELTIDRALATYLKKGYSREWINQRLQAIQVRKELTDEWDDRGNMLAEATTTEISRSAEPQTFEENKQVARRGGKIAGNARKEIEADTGKPVITKNNALDFPRLLYDVIEKSENED